MMLTQGQMALAKLKTSIRMANDGIAPTYCPLWLINHTLLFRYSHRKALISGLYEVHV